MAYPGTYNFSYYKGDTLQFRVYPKDNAGNAFDLTPYVGNAQFTIATQRGNDADLSVACLAVIDNGSVLCTIRPADGNQLSSGSYVYDVEIRDNSGSFPYIYTILSGTIQVTEQVTGAS